MQITSTLGRIELVKKYLSDYPLAPTMTIAKKLFKEHPLNFTTLESARSALRYRRGQSGKKNYKFLADTKHLKDPGSNNPFDDIPEGLTTLDDWRPLPIVGERVLRLCDIHIPYHNKPALITALKYGKQEGVDTIIMDDVFDFHAISNWEKDPEKRDFQGELDTAYKIFGIIRNEFPDAKMILKKGNHEFRYDRYMRIKAPEFLSVKDFQFKKIIHADEFGIEVVDDKKMMRLGDLYIVHGHEFGRSISSPVNAARGLWLRAKYNCICGHFHQPSYHSEPIINGSVLGCWSVGCLCDLHPDWLPVNKWAHGVAVLYRTGTKSFRVNNKTIIDGELY